MIEKKDSITVQNAGRYVADIITGAIIKIQKGLKIPPVKYNKKPNCKVSNNKKENAFILLIDLFFLSSKYE